MTTQILTTELSILIQDSKRKNSELKSAAEKSLNDLKSLPSTSESQIAADLSRRPNFISPFLVACGTRNVKFTGSAVVCLQRLAVSQGLPKERLKEVLEAFREATSLNLEIQLKILQALPTLLQNYAGEFKGELLSSALHVCFILQNSKTAVVNNTATATMVQLLAFVFEKVVEEDKSKSDLPTIAEISVPEGSVHVRAAAFDAHQIFNDLCLLVDGQKPKVLRLSAMPQALGLELIESVMSNNPGLFLSHFELSDVLRTRLLPSIVKSLSEGLDFSLAVRIFRILQIILRRHIAVLVPECEVALDLLTRMLDPGSTALWERALCMELFKGLYAENGLARRIYGLYDEQEGGKPILGDQLAALVRLSSEKPAVIGLGHQSAAPVGHSMSKDTSNDQAVIEAGSVAGIIGGAIGLNDSGNVGISTQWSLLRIPCIDQLDKAEPPILPESYIYSMALTCINSFLEDLARFILPLTMLNEGKGKKKVGSAAAQEEEGPQPPNGVGPSSLDPPRRSPPRRQSYKKSQLPTNPLTLTTNSLYPEIRTAAAIVENCWPAVLATCSTFLKATLDSGFFHGLVRSFQKFTHVAGLLRLSTPRDAFLTTLGKAAVPPSIFVIENNSTPSTPSIEASGIFSNAKGLLSVEGIVGQSSASFDKTRQSSADEGLPTLDTRNLLCLRALLNLGIALGPTLDKAWSIILETLQQADYVIFAASRRSGNQISYPSQQGDGHIGSNTSALVSNLASEISAVETAASRMLQSTLDFPNESFLHILEALCKLLNEPQGTSKESEIVVPASPARRTSMQIHRRLNSMSGVPTTTSSHMQEMHFVLVKIGELAKVNMTRLNSSDPGESGWNLITKELISVACSGQFESAVRLRAAEVLGGIVIESASFTVSTRSDSRCDIQQRALLALKDQTSSLYDLDQDGTAAVRTVDFEVHRTALEALKAILERSGDSLIAGWDLVLDIIMSAFSTGSPTVQDGIDKSSAKSTLVSVRSPLGKSPKLVRSSFGSLQLICSDYLSSLPSFCVQSLIRGLFSFCSQDHDLNISLTTITFFWNVSNFLQGQSHPISLGARLLKACTEDQLIEISGSENAQDSHAALWMLLLLRLAGVTTDQRSEVRNGAVQTLLRIFDAYGDLLTPDSWSRCLQTVIFRMTAMNRLGQQQWNSSENFKSQKRSGTWNETTILVVEGVVGLFASYLEIFVQQEDFMSCWQELMDYLENLLSYQLLDVTASIYSALERLFEKVEDAEIIGQPSVESVFELWAKHMPTSTNVQPSSELRNHDAMLSYVKMFKEMYRPLKDTLTTARAKNILGNLGGCIQQTDTSTQSTSSESLTSLQRQVMEVLKGFRTDVPGVPSAILFLLSHFIDLAFKPSSEDDAVNGVAFLALSKASITLLQSVLVKHKKEDEIYETNAVLASLEALIRPIKSKYQQQLTGKSPPTWHIATSAAIGVVQATLPMLREIDIDTKVLIQYWKQVIQITEAVIAADGSPTPSTADNTVDHDFDLESFQQLRRLISPALGASNIPDILRREYAGHIFSTSIIHQPTVGELPKPGRELLAGLYKPRLGRTYDPPPARRSQMSYACLDELFALVSLHDGSTERIKLAQAAAPFLILRVGITLRGYIFDHPLRGRMPQPGSQRRELLYILRALVDLRCEPRAIPDAPGVSSQHRKHLHRLFPLVCKAVGVAARDELVLRELQRVLEVVGDGFGIA